MKYTFQGDVVLVSGAGSGIGEATARLLAANGLRVVVSDIDAGTAGRVAGAIVADGGTAVAHAGDVSRPEDAESAVALAVREFGALQLAFNNAGIGAPFKPAGELTTEEWRRVIDINLSGCYWMAQACGKVMQPGSSVINRAFVDRNTLPGHWRLVDCR